MIRKCSPLPAVNPSSWRETDGWSTMPRRVGDSLRDTMGIYTGAKRHARPPSDKKNNRTGTRSKRRESRRVSSEVTAQHRKARLVDSGWFMGTRSRVSGELAGSSESRRPSPQLGRAGPKLPAIGSSTVLGRRGGPRAGGQQQRYKRLLRCYAAGAVTASSLRQRVHR